MKAQVEEQEEEEEADDGGDEGAGAKMKRFTKELRTGIYEPCSKTLYTEYRCYDVDITDPRYKTKRGARTVFVSQENECHCGKMCDDQADLALHVTNDHPANSVWVCFFCTHTSSKSDYMWKEGTNGRRYGNDELTSVWAHMMKCHGLRNPLGCPLCKDNFSGKAIQRKHIASSQELPKPSREKLFVCPKEDSGKRYVDQEALDTHIADHEDKIEHPVCQYCGKQLSTLSALKLHKDIRTI